MTFQYLSDLHLEFPDNRNWVKKNIKPKYDYLLIAGDLGYLTDKRDNNIYENYCDDFLKFCHDNWKQTILIPGNHEYYGGFPLCKKNVLGLDQNSISKFKIHDNVTLINNDFIDIDNKDFVIRVFGATLWSYIKPEEFHNVWKRMNDYNYCYYKEGEILNPGHTILEHLKTYTEIAKLKDIRYKSFYNAPETPKGDIHITKKPIKYIIMTHHGCHPDCIADCYRSSDVNSAYTSDLSNLIDKVKPVAWIYGHTHQTKSFEYNGVKIMENSLGYVKYDSIDHFNKKAVLEV